MSETMFHGTAAKAPWETYSESFNQKLSPELEEAVKRYSERVHEKSSQQNEEELCRQREMSQDMAREYQFLRPEEYADQKPRIGKIMHSSEFISKLQKECNLKCWYRPHPQKGKVTLVAQRGSGTIPPEVGCWAQNGFMQEFSLVSFDDHGVPLAEKRRGWRTCLLQIIIKGLVSEQLAHKVFGSATGPASKRYNSTLFGFRNEYKK